MYIRVCVCVYMCIYISNMCVCIASYRNICRYVLYVYALCICSVCVFPTSVHWDGLEAIASWELWPHLASKSWFLKPSPTTRSQGSWEKWLTPGLGQGKHKRRLETSLGPESKEELKKIMKTCQKSTGGSLKGLSMAESGQPEHSKK